MSKTKKELWSKKEVKFLRNNWSVMTGSQIAEELGRGRNAVYTKAASLGLRKNIKHKVTVPRAIKRKEDIKPLGIQQKLNFTPTNVKIIKRRAWSSEEDKLLADLYKTISYAELGKRLGRSKQAICDRVRNKGLEKKFSSVRSPRIRSEVPKPLSIVKNNTNSKHSISIQDIVLIASTAINIGLVALVTFLLYS